MWITVEGINGVGKTHLLHALAHQLGDQCGLVTELTDGGSGNLPKAVIAALTDHGDFFLRTGNPNTETLALLALKVHEYERMSTRQLPPIVLEDRGVDTVTLYQAAILAGSTATLADIEDIAARIDATAALWRPVPDLTLLITDDVDTCLHRLAQREDHTLSKADRALVRTVDQLYKRRAAADPERWRVIDRTDRRSDDVLTELHQTCLEHLPHIRKEAPHA